jgi:hypothetical protein
MAARSERHFLVRCFSGLRFSGQCFPAFPLGGYLVRVFPLFLVSPFPVANGLNALSQLEFCPHPFRARQSL